ncbi:LysR family transcriptional regulator [Pseudomonas sp. TH34]|jgi:LysR family glycine cleavage system transcriptional activator|uniref:LysR family transcriptional regulator n=1 Tax=Pseudomonas yamanorum TaxID=515393 RepID=A0AAJ3LJR9_9PSED|nr:MULTISPECIES: LysR substrate-binding domain-containing protein [Pseudomonas]MBK5411625.1 LysR family transcriptional regulator [Pseudomonas sp. TH34]MBV6663428.1 LysR family transcriptional regulator [Pseudomonas yamanorum]NVZ92670.1 LysR family transcriptional regulator [Pseudomonas yamanorum]NWD45684.1 LysR family transcriptional regulator [Pseudomonas yamanorum]WVN19081.1 LysR substrate-binding domain-containing protein [Pseudomonas yamanorum]
MLNHWPPLGTLRGFEAAARLGSFHKAAEELHLTQSAISQQIRSLEAYLEQPLFFRSGRSVSLTDAGHDFLSTTQALLQQLAVGVRRLGQYRKPNQLVLNTTPTFARHWLLPRLEDFRRQHPEVDLWIFSTDEVPDMASQTIDLAVRDDISSQAECSFKVLHADRLFPACHPRVLALPKEQRTTLHGEREMDWSHWAVEAGIDVGQKDQGLNFSDPGLLLDAACTGLGIALVSRLLSRQALESGLLQPLVEATIRGPNWALLTHRDSENNPLARCFSEWLIGNLATAGAG